MGFHWVEVVQHECLLFAVAGLLIGGIDDLTFDLLFLARWGWRRLFVYSRHERMTASTLPASVAPGRMAVFVPAWNEAAVIGAMLTRACGLWTEQQCRIFVGTYPNDADTIAAVASVARNYAHVHLVIVPVDGPTTKADCLNRLWHAMVREENATGTRFKAVVLHDAEDVVHRDEPRLFDTMIDRFAMVQLPVRPLISQQSQWIAGHYADEFAESHGKTLRTREALGASVPSAGVGCAFDRDVLGELAATRGGDPFDPQSLTEDYEIGLRMAEAGRRTAFIAMRDADGVLICTQEHFPETIREAVQQKSRWFAGIALAGWDRMGWAGSWRERWMRLHDRRAVFSALVLLAAYGATIGYGLMLIGAWTGVFVPEPLSPTLALAMECTAGLMLWRLAMRFAFSTRAYGWRQGLLAIPRSVIANVIAMLAARRAVWIYVRQWRGGAVVWDKTTHRFPHGGDHPPHAAA
ncbi:glycosyl transferase family protein [Sphingobium subterraneum]|uniref:Adsorption protein B n=1 Tax=Sphingobium subterraneum TaxID=627688 RepID=A0A841J9Z2_9SPHN|nr:glycosyl transferase family protein [Sphingobium subterraneum]MBB6124961.1 adsorption protein B [Sphingobium subterraneum]